MRALAAWLRRRDETGSLNAALLCWNNVSSQPKCTNLLTIAGPSSAMTFGSMRRSS